MKKISLAPYLGAEVTCTDGARYPLLAANRLAHEILEGLRIAGRELVALRISYVGELGWELYTPVEFAVGVYETLLAAGLARIPRVIHEQNAVGMQSVVPLGLSRM